MAIERNGTPLPSPTLEPAVMPEIRDLIHNGTLHDDPSSPTLFVVTVVGSQRSERTEDVTNFIRDLALKYHHAQIVVGDTSTLEREAAEAARDMNLHVAVVEKADKGEWDEGATCRDEKVVALSTQVVLFDDSARSKSYAALAKRMRKSVHAV